MVMMIVVMEVMNLTRALPGHVVQVRFITESSVD